MKLAVTFACFCLVATASALAKFDGRITNGDVASRMQFPYIAHLEITGGEYDECSAVLISHHNLITAAHCIVRATKIEITLGAHDLQSKTEAGRQVITITDNRFFIPHPRYDHKTQKHDIAVIELPEAINTTDYIKTIDLPTYDFELRNEEKVTFSGWGDLNDQGVDAKTLKYFDGEIMEYSECINNFRNIIPASKVCVKNKDGKAGCKGDSGGPLVVNRNGRLILAGILSFGYKQCEPGKPTVFTKISSYLIWLESTTILEV